MLDAEELLRTTRAVRRRLDLERPVPIALVEECLDIALQAPSGSNQQGWHFVIVSDAERRAALAELYRRSFAAYEARVASGEGPGEAVLDSSRYLAANLERVPVHLITCVEGRPEGRGALGLAALYGSILPATWSFCLAARARGLGTVLTTLHLSYEAEAAALLGLPESVTQVALVPVAYLLGEGLHPAKRRPLSSVVHHNAW